MDKFRCIYDLILCNWVALSNGGFSIQLKKEIMGAKIKIILYPTELIYEVRNVSANGHHEYLQAIKLIENCGYNLRKEPTS